MGLRGDWQLVTLTRLFLSSKNKKKKTSMSSVHPCLYLVLVLFTELRKDERSEECVRFVF